MLIESSSDLIRSLQVVELPSGIVGHEASLINGNALVVTEDALALFRRSGDCLDPLGNGLIRSVSIPPSACLNTDQCQSKGEYIREHKAGYVGLCDGQVLLITLNAVQMFPTKSAALRNKEQIINLSLVR